MQRRFLLATMGFAIALFFGMLLFLEIGHRLGLHQVATLGEAARTGVGVADSAIYALLALLLGFTFSGATSRFDHRRDLIIAQKSTIETAWQRIDTLPSARQPAIRNGFRQYVDALLASYHKQPNGPDNLRASETAIATQKDIWEKAVAACLADDGEKARMLLLPALNEMFVAVGKERVAWRVHPPRVIYVMLAIAALAAALFAGYAMASGPTRNWLFYIAIAGVISVVVYVILELEFPRLGLVRVNAMDELLAEVREKMGVNEHIRSTKVLSRSDADAA